MDELSILFIFIALVLLGYLMLKLIHNTIGLSSLISHKAGGRSRHHLNQHLPKDRIKNLITDPRSNTERNIIKILEKETGKKFPSIYPTWLKYKGKQLELDGYNKDLALAIEVDGPHHSKWDSNKESYIKYFHRLQKDKAKDHLCKANNVTLLRIDSRLPSEHWRDYLLSRLWDYKFVTTEPANYIKEQTFDKFRNEIIEMELGLKFDH